MTVLTYGRARPIRGSDIARAIEVPKVLVGRLAVACISTMRETDRETDRWRDRETEVFLKQEGRGRAMDEDFHCDIESMMGLL